MPRGMYLGEFELFILAALDHLGSDAYGVTIRDEIGRRSGRLPTFGAIYATLERLGEKGYVAFSTSAPQPVQGGRARKFARLTPAGRRVLRDSVRAIDAMLDGLSVRVLDSR